MSNDAANPGESTRIDLAAAEWLVKRDRGFTAAEQDAFLQWIAADPRHGEWFARHQQTWREFNLLAQWRPEHSVEPNPDLLARPQPRRRWFAPAGLAIAASIALSFTLWTLSSSAPPEISLAPVRAIAAQAYERHALADGSTVELNRGGVVEVQYSPGERRVLLRQGEAHFTVTKNPARPFVVRAGGVDVRAIGTAFNVRLEHESVEVLVTAGRVGLEHVADGARAIEGHLTPASSAPPDATPLRSAATFAELAANERARISLSLPLPAEPVIERISIDAVRAALDWQPQLLDFNSTPLREVIDEFNRRNGGRVQLVLTDPSLGTIPIVASIRSDNIDGFVRLLESATGIRAERRGHESIVLRMDR